MRYNDIYATMTTQLRISALVCLLTLISNAALAAPLTENQIKRFESFIVGEDQNLDATRPIYRPDFISTADASLALERDEIVFVEEPSAPNTPVRIYPRRILVHHEVVNVPQEDHWRAITYCPFTGSVIGYIGEVNGEPAAIGTTGQLLNSNRILYDHATRSHWPQILGEAISGSATGQELEAFPLLWTTWNRARKYYPDALVLARPRNRMAPRAYGKDPYGSYQRTGTYYDTGGSYFPLAFTDTRVHPKTRIIGVADNGAALAIKRDAIIREKAVTVDYGLTPVAAFYDPYLDTARVYSATVGERTLSFEIIEGTIMDRETHSHWNHLGLATEGRLRGTKLKTVVSMECMWFAWRAFYNYTRFWDGDFLSPF